MKAGDRRIAPLANDHVTLFESPSPETVYTYSPGIAKVAHGEGRLSHRPESWSRGGQPGGGGRLVASIDLGGPGMAEWPEPKGIRYGKPVQGKVFTSDDGGRGWTHRVDFPFMMARPFVAGESVYVLGLAGDLRIIRSDDGGETWSDPAKLTQGEEWTQAPSNVWYANGCVYLVMNKRPYPHERIWAVSVEAPVLMRGRVDEDLTQPERWTFSSVLPFRDIVTPDDLDYFGVPFFESPYDRPIQVAPGRSMSPIGWLETNVVQFTDPDHIWCDPTGRIFHLWSRAHTGGTGYAALAKAVETGPEGGTGEIEVHLETVPSGKRILYVPCPGGQMKFHVVYDDQTRLYWLLSTQATDSMTRPDRLPSDRYGLPNNERRRLQLHFSKNMVDWRFAGLVAVGSVEKASRHYASMTIDGDDLVVLSRSGDARAKSAHDGNMITVHRIEGFRELVY